MKYSLLFFLFLLLFKFHTNAQCNGRYLQDVFDSVTVIRDIEFGRSVTSDGDTLILKMDVYMPYGDVENNRPLIIWAHGGSFTGGDKNTPEVTIPCIAMTKRGYVTASVNYRVESNLLALLNAESMIKAVMRAVQDFKAAIRFFRKDAFLNGNTFGIDTTEIILGGDSAGGIIALHTIYLDDTAELEVQFRKYIPELGGIEGNSGNTGYSSQGLAVVQVSGALRDVKYMNNNKNIPVFSCHNELDLTVPYGTFYPYFIPSLPMVQGSQVISDQARRLGIYHDLYTVSGLGHVPYRDDNTGSPVHPVIDSMINKMSRFLYKILDCNPDHIILKTNTITFQNALTIFPNPARDLIQIEYKSNATSNSIKTIQIYTIYGEMVIEQNFFSGTFNEIHVDNLQKGMYILNVVDDSDNIVDTKKIIRQ